MKKFFVHVAAMTLSMLLAGWSLSRAQEPYYKGKTIRIVVGYSAGGGFDIYARAIARYFGKHIPGNPTVIVENMTGAVGLIAANYVYNKAKPDGLTIGHFVGTLVLQHALGNKAAEFDGRKFGWLGVPTPVHGVCALTKTSGISSLGNWFAAKEPVKLGGHGPGAITSDTARILDLALGLPIKVIDGYKGTADIRLAADSGEIAGSCWAWESVKVMWKQSLESAAVRVVLQNTLKPHPDLKDVPVAVNYVKTREGRQLLELVDRAYGAAIYPYAVPPGTPSDRLEILQRAFLETLNDREFLGEAKKASLDVSPLDGPALAKILAGFYEIEAPVKEKLRKILMP